jgi:hypothetical protein
LYNDFSFHGVSLVLDMYGCPICIISLQRLLCVLDHTDGMRKGFARV